MKLMKNNYTSMLSKNALAYNLAYHLSNLQEGENPYSVIEKILTQFEDRGKKIVDPQSILSYNH